MVITMLQANVLPERVADLERAYRERTTELPPEIVESFLVRDAREPFVFEIVTVWRDREALEAMRASGVTPTGVQIFRAAAAEPKLSILEVVVHRARPY